MLKKFVEVFSYLNTVKLFLEDTKLQQSTRSVWYTLELHFMLAWNIQKDKQIVAHYMAMLRLHIQVEFLFVLLKFVQRSLV